MREGESGGRLALYIHIPQVIIFHHGPARFLIPTVFIQLTRQRCITIRCLVREALSTRIDTDLDHAATFVDVFVVESYDPEVLLVNQSSTSRPPVLVLGPPYRNWDNQFATSSQPVVPKEVFFGRRNQQDFLFLL